MVDSEDCQLNIYFRIFFTLVNDNKQVRHIQRTKFNDVIAWLLPPAMIWFCVIN